jgi:hypothetical protein
VVRTAKHKMNGNRNVKRMSLRRIILKGSGVRS